MPHDDLHPLAAGNLRAAPDEPTRDEVDALNDQVVVDALDDSRRGLILAARTLATGRLARQEGIPRREARHRVARVSDEQVYAKAAEAGVSVAAAEVGAGGIKQWISDHWALIQQIAAIIIAIAGLL